MSQDSEPQPNDLQLWKQLRVGETPAFETVVAQHYRPLYRQLYSLTGNADQAADLTQATFVEAWKSLRSFRGRSSLRTWLHTIAVRIWWRQQRQVTNRDTESVVLPSAS